jgi:hypothetical protein
MVILPALRCLTGTNVSHLKAHRANANLGRAAKTNEGDKAALPDSECIDQLRQVAAVQQ